MKDKAFELIFREHNKMITSFIYSIIRDWERVAEICQDVFVIAYTKMGEVYPKYSMPAWLRGIAKNLCRKEFSKKNRSKQFLLDGSDIENIFSTFDKYKTDLLWEERLDALDTCIEKLPETEKISIKSFYQEDKACRIIADMLGVEEKTIFRSLWQARKNLKHCIESLSKIEQLRQA